PQLDPDPGCGILWIDEGAARVDVDIAHGRSVRADVIHIRPAWKYEDAPCGGHAGILATVADMDKAAAVGIVGGIANRDNFVFADDSTEVDIAGPNGLVVPLSPDRTGGGDDRDVAAAGPVENTIAALVIGAVPDLDETVGTAAAQ